MLKLGPLLFPSFALTLLLIGCGDDTSPEGAGASSSGGSGTGGSGADGTGGGAQGGAGTGASATGGDGTGGGGAGAVGCEPLPPPVGNVIDVDPSQTGQLQQIVNNAAPGDTIALADGTYALNGSYLWISAAGVTLRSQSGNREAVILDGNYQGTELVSVSANDVTIADLTIMRAYTHPIHVTTEGSADTTGVRIYNVHVIDPRQQAIKINSNGGGGYADDGEVACSHIELTDAGRPTVDPGGGGCYTGGVDAHQARGWVVRDNRIEGFWCNTGLSEHGVHFWTGGRDTVVERNVLIDNARGVGFGLGNSGNTRSYADSPCPAAGGNYVGHYDGIVRNNFISANGAGLVASPNGPDCGICFESACGARAVHNSVISTGAPYSSIEWRFAGATGVEITNNIATHELRERDGASATLAGNLESAPLSLFVDGNGGNLHLAPGASAAIDQGVTVAGGLCDDDIDSEPRAGARDIGADELP